MTIQVQRPGGGPDVTRANKRSILYLTTAPTIDSEIDKFSDIAEEDSVRIVPSKERHEVTFEIKREGIFQPAGIDLSAQSLSLGLDLNILAQGSQLNIESVEAGTEDLSIGARFDDTGSDVAKVPILGQRINRLVIQSDTSEDKSFFTDSDSFVGVTNAFRYTFYFKTGSLAATANVTLEISKGITAGGEIFFRKEMPASDWPANTEVVVELEGGLNITSGNSFTSTLSSPNEFSLLGNFTSSAGRFVALDVQPFVFETLISTPSGTDRFLTALDSEFIADNSGNMVLSGSQVSQTSTMDINGNPPIFTGP